VDVCFGSVTDITQTSQASLKKHNATTPRARKRRAWSREKIKFPAACSSEAPLARSRVQQDSVADALFASFLSRTKRESPAGAKPGLCNKIHNNHQNQHTQNKKGLKPKLQAF